VARPEKSAIERGFENSSKSDGCVCERKKVNISCADASFTLASAACHGRCHNPPK
jgi:hypothetical protein